MPDTDNLLVAAAFVAGMPADGLHRTFSHSFLTVAAIILMFTILGRLAKQPRWGRLGWGLGAGVSLHILLDLIVWFNGVQLLWPWPLWVNFWQGVTPPAWWSSLMNLAEFVAFAAYFMVLATLAHRDQTDSARIRQLQLLAGGQMILFVILLMWAIAAPATFLVPYGAMYLISLGLALGLTVQMRHTIGNGVLNSNKNGARHQTGD